MLEEPHKVYLTSEFAKSSHSTLGLRTLKYLLKSGPDPSQPDFYEALEKP